MGCVSRCKYGKPQVKLARGNDRRSKTNTNRDGTRSNSEGIVILFDDEILPTKVIAFGGCAVMKREREIQQIKTQNKIAYAEAVRRINQREGIEGGPSRTRLTMEVQEEVTEKKMLKELKLVKFIAGVINATMEIKSKTERIQVIVKLVC